MSSSTAGYIGLGNAGYHMAACLGKTGYSLAVRDADPYQLELLIGDMKITKDVIGSTGNLEAAIRQSLSSNSPNILITKLYSDCTPTYVPNYYFHPSHVWGDE